MKIKFAVFSALVMSTIALAPSTTSAVVIPPNPGDFIVSIQPGAIAQNQIPTCTPGLATIGERVMRGETVNAVCTVSATSPSSTVTGTASNPTLASSTGDSGFTSGAISANCNSSQSVDVTVAISQSGSTINSFAGKVFQGCTFVMEFQDAAKSALLGTIEVNATLGNSDGTVAGNALSVTINANVFVTSGTGAFSGYSGNGTFSQTQDIDINPTSQSTPSTPQVTQADALALCASNSITPCTAQKIAEWCTANGANPQASSCATVRQNLGLVRGSSVRAHSVRATADTDASTMSLTLTKSNGRARIVSPAPPAGTPKGTAKVKASTRIRVTAPAGSTCTVKTSSGKTVGTGKVTGKYAAVSIKPRSGAYKNAKKIVATCKTKAGKTLKSNAVKVSL